MQNRVLILPMIAAIFFIGTMLSGCSTPLGTKVIRTNVDIPVETFNCEAPGVRPSGEIIMESDVARYVNSLEFAEKDCRTRLKEVQVLIKCANEPTCDPKLLTELLAVAKPEGQR
jgi:hypothetical protein